MSTTRHKARETAPPRQYQAAIVVPMVVFAFLAGAAAGYSIGRMGRDDCTEVLPVSDSSVTSTSTSATPANGMGVRCLD